MYCYLRSWINDVHNQTSTELPRTIVRHFTQGTAEELNSKPCDYKVSFLTLLLFGLMKLKPFPLPYNFTFQILVPFPFQPYNNE